MYLRGCATLTRVYVRGRWCRCGLWQQGLGPVENVSAGAVEVLLRLTLITLTVRSKAGPLMFSMLL
jgi:hypothetical protein